MPWKLRLLALYLFSAFLFSCGYTATYDGTLSLGRRGAASSELERLDSRPAILNQQGGNNGTKYDWVDAKGNTCSFYVEVTTNAVSGLCTLLAKEGSFAAQAVSFRESEVDRHTLQVVVSWKPAEARDGSTLETTFVGVRR